jgi:hypothetical protein
MPFPAEFDDIKRQPGATTKDGTEWETRLNRMPPEPWKNFFMKPNEATSVHTPAGVDFRNVGGETALFFRADATQVEDRLRWIDKWIVWANRNYRRWFEEEQQRREQGSVRAQAEAERIRELNERFKNS